MSLYAVQDYKYMGCGNFSREICEKQNKSEAKPKQSGGSGDGKANPRPDQLLVEIHACQ